MASPLIYGMEICVINMYKNERKKLFTILMSATGILGVVLLIIFASKAVSEYSSDTTRHPDDMYTSDNTATSDIIDDGENSTTDAPAINRVFNINSQSDLEDTIASEDFKKCISNGIYPTISINSNFTLTKDIIINEAVNIRFTTSDFNKSSINRIIINTDKNADITIDCGISDILQSTLAIEGPSLNVTWKNPCAADMESAMLYLNVKSYNKQEPSFTGVTLGGHTTATIKDIIYYKNNTKKENYQDTSFKIAGNTIELYIPHEVKDTDIKSTLPEFITNSGNFELINPKNSSITLGYNDIYVKLSDDNGGSRNYVLNVKRKVYGIPIVYIDTEGPVLNKIDYVRGSMTIDGEVYPLRIKGRGNSSWTFPKKAYRLKLDEKASILGMEDDKDWVLVSSYPDKSLIRNCISTDMANVLTNLEYTPSHKLIDLFYNGEYMGVYTLAEKIEEGKKKVNLNSDHNTYKPNSTTPTDIGFLIEYGWDYDSENIYNLDYFDTKHTIRLYVKEPEITQVNSPEMKYVKKYMNALDEAIVSGQNYEDYIDMASWVDWFILVELTNNTEVSFYRSCFLYKKAGDKVYMGPIWDYDMAFGNFLGDIQTYDKWCTGEATYTYTRERNLMIYLVKDPKFMSAVKERWNEIKQELLTAGLDAADNYSTSLQGSEIQNFKRWNILNKQIGMGASNYKKYDTYELQVQYIKEFLNKRYEWMDNELNTKW